jgi:hypothetical protein
MQAQGAMVMNSPREVEQAYRDYSQGQFGVPWDHKLTDEEWLQHVAKHRNAMMQQKDQ